MIHSGPILEYGMREIIIISIANKDSRMLTSGAQSIIKFVAHANYTVSHPLQLNSPFIEQISTVRA